MNEREYFEKIAQYRLLAKHEIGQNFLIEPEIAWKIIEFLKIENGDNILEIGCGAGSLTYFLSEQPGRCTSIDIDEAMVTKVKEDFASCESVDVRIGNAMKWDYSSYDRIVGNLPYYITSGIVERCLLGGAKAKRMVFMVQKEWYQRLFSSPKTKDYGPLSVLMAYRGKKEKGFVVSRNCFSPAPHVDSVVFAIETKEGTDLETAKKLYDLTSSLFLHRRKTVLNNLTLSIKDGQKAEIFLKKAQLASNLRPEEIDLNGYLRLFAVLN